MRQKPFVPTVLLRLILLTSAALVLATYGVAAAGYVAPNGKPTTEPASEARVEFWNRPIAMQRGTLAGMSAQERAERAEERLTGLPLNVSASEIVFRPIKVENR